jgi:hypothetical protein
MAVLSLAACACLTPQVPNTLRRTWSRVFRGWPPSPIPRLVNPWGIARTPTSPFWTSNQGTNSSTLYAVTGSTNVTQVLGVNANGFVAIPTTAAGPQGPTGQVSNTEHRFLPVDPGTASTSAASSSPT